MTKLNSQLREDLKNFLKARLHTDGVYAQIFAPYALSEQEIAAIRGKFAIIKDAHITTHVDTSLLGGFVIKVGSQLIDCSIKNHIQSVFQTS